MDKLAQLIKQSKYTVVLTGAGISTSAGIPDFRGPNGIWTREQQRNKDEKKKSKKRKSGDITNDGNVNGDSKQKFISFETAQPTYTHRALTHLILHPPPTSDNKSDIEDGNNKDNTKQRTYLHHIVTQNVDGLHRKTSLPRSNMSVLHGCIFTEICDTCQTEHVSKTEIQSIGLKHTGRHCTLGGSPKGSCPGKLKDTLLDWEDALPEADWLRAQEECAKADLVLCLGTSLRIEPAAALCTYPTDYPWPWDSAEGTPPEDDEYKSKTQQGKKKKAAHRAKTANKIGYVIVNLQTTPYDNEVGNALIVRAKVDDVMRVLMEKLGYKSDWDKPA